MNVSGWVLLLTLAFALSGCSMDAKLSEILSQIGTGSLKVEAPPLPTDSSFPSDKYIINSASVNTDIVVTCPSDATSVIVVSPSSIAGTYSCVATKAMIPFDVSQVLDGDHQLQVVTTQGQAAVLDILKDTVPPTASLDVSISDYINKHTQSSFSVSGVCSDANQKVLIAAVLDADSSQVVQREVSCSSSHVFATTLNVSSLSEGNVTLSLKHYDAAGNFVNASKALIKDITDAAVPTLSFTPSGTTSLSQLVTSVSGTDVVSYQFKVGRQDMVVCSQQFDYSSIYPIATGINHDLTNLGDHPLRLCVQSIDIAGNVLTSSQILQVDWVRDSASVQVLLSGYTPAGLTSNSAGVRTVTASGSEVTHYKSVVINSGTCATADFSAVSEQAVSTVISVNASSSGTYQVCAIGRNLAGVWQTTPTSSSVLTIDLDAPTVTLAATSSSPTAISPVTFSATFSEAVSGFAALDLNVVNGTASISGSGSSYTISVTPTGSGSVSVQLLANSVQDAAGNFNASNSSTVTVMYDVTAPAAPSVANNGYTTTSSDSPNVVWGASSDAHSGVARYEIALGTTSGGSDISSWTSIGNVTSYKVTGLTLAEQTLYYPSVRAVDNAGNVSTVGVGNGFYYYITPTVTSISPSSGPVVGGTSITVTGTNFIGAMKVWISGVQCSSLVISSSTSMTCTTPSHTAGAKLVNVQNPANQSALVSDGFTYNSPPSGKQEFLFTGADQAFTIPTGVTSVTIKAWGAGGTVQNMALGADAGQGAAGAYATGVLSVSPGDNIAVMVGGQNGYGGGSNNGGGRSAVFKNGTEVLTAGGGGGGGFYADGVNNIYTFAPGDGMGGAGGASSGSAFAAGDFTDAVLKISATGGSGASQGTTGVNGTAVCNDPTYYQKNQAPPVGPKGGLPSGGGGYAGGGGGSGCGNHAGTILIYTGGGGGSSYVGGVTSGVSEAANGLTTGNPMDTDRTGSNEPQAGDSSRRGLVIISW